MIDILLHFFCLFIYASFILLEYQFNDSKKLQNLILFIFYMDNSDVIYFNL